MLAHWYHCYAAGAWREPVAEHLATLADSGFAGTFHLGLVGSPSQRRACLSEITLAYRAPDELVEATTGWEQVTLRPLWQYTTANDGAVLYCHSKGAGHPHSYQAVWRRWMDFRLTRGWRQHAAVLASGEVDAIGSHWLTPDDGAMGGAHFGGNYWLATCDYLRTLGPPREADRFDAEWWIGTGSPRVVDLCPGWPHDLPPITAHRRVSRPDD